MTRVVLAAEGVLLRSALRRSLAARAVLVVAETEREHEVVPLAAAEAPAVVLLDAALLGSPPSTLAVEALRARNHSVVVLARGLAPAEALALLKAGASGLVSIECGLDELVAGLEAAARGGSPLEPSIAAAVLDTWRRSWDAATRPERERLTPRETDVLDAMSQGLPTKAIAGRLGVSEKTVEQHKTRIFTKLGVRNQAQAVAVALTRGLLPERAGAGP